MNIAGFGFCLFRIWGVFLFFKHIYIQRTNKEKRKAQRAHFGHRSWSNQSRQKDTGVWREGETDAIVTLQRDADRTSKKQAASWLSIGEDISYSSPQNMNYPIQFNSFSVTAHNFYLSQCPDMSTFLCDIFCFGNLQVLVRTYTFYDLHFWNCHTETATTEL